MEKVKKTNKDYQISLKGILSFEVKSLCGRLFLNSKPYIISSNKNFLNLGCGLNKFEGWVNADFFAFRSKNKPDWMLDLRYPLNCDDNVWDGVFSEHTLEHLYPDQAKKLIQSIFRTMKPGTWFRLAVPDLKKYINYYSGQKEHDMFAHWDTGCEAIRALTQDYFHLSLWDAELLTRYLIEVGFINIKEVNFMQGSDPKLLKDQEARLWETLYMEAQKPLNI